MERSEEALSAAERCFAEAPEVMPPSFAPHSTRASCGDTPAEPERHKSSGQRAKRIWRRKKNTDTPLIDEAEPVKRRFLSGFLQTILMVAGVLLLFVVVRTFFIQPFFVPSGSMENTIMTGDTVMVNKMVNQPDEIHRGDIVVFRDPGGWLDNVQEPERGKVAALVQNIGKAIGIVPKDAGMDLVKRVIGVGGDHVKCCTPEGLVSVNGAPIKETYLHDSDTPSSMEFDVVVPQGYVWVMGDNRANSADSRTHHERTGFGYVPVSNIEGRVWLVYLPLDRFHIVHSGEDAFAHVPEPNEEAATSGSQ